MLREKEWPKEFIDYEFVDNDGAEKVTSIRILKGKFEGVVYHYGKVEVVDEEPPRIKFDYYVNNPGKFDVKDLKSNKKFTPYTKFLFCDWICSTRFSILMNNSLWDFKFLFLNLHHLK